MNDLTPWTHCSSGCLRQTPAGTSSDQARRRRERLVERARGTSATRRGSGGPSRPRRARARRRSPRLGAPRVRARRATRRRARRAAPRSAAASRRSAGRRAAARRCRSSGSPRAGRRRRSGPAGGAVEPTSPARTRSPPERAPFGGDREPQVLAVADRGELGELAAGREQRHARVSEPERRERRQLLAEVERELAAVDDRVDRQAPAEFVLASAPAACAAKASRERLEALRADREAGGGAVAAPARRGARRTRPARREGRRPGSSARSRPTRPSPGAISTTGRRNRSTSRDATIPITPRCQSSPAST